MAPNSKILLIRHGEATHNVANDFEQHDPHLTDLGKEQCKKLLRDSFASGECKNIDKVQLIVISPLVRTLETGTTAFEDQINGGVTTIILPEVQETSNRPCDTGHKTEFYQNLFPDLDFSELDRTHWLVKTSGFFHPDYLNMRALWVRKWLYERPEEFIAIVTHSGFLRWMTPQYFPHVENRDAYRNCEYREYYFADLHSDKGDGAPYRMIESGWSKQLRVIKRAEQDSVQLGPSGEAVASASGNVPPEDNDEGTGGNDETRVIIF